MKSVTDESNMIQQKLSKVNSKAIQFFVIKRYKIQPFTRKFVELLIVEQQECNTYSYQTT